MSQPGPRWPRFASPGSCLSRAVTRVSGMRARSDVCSEMRLAMMPPVLTNGLSLLCDSRQRWKKPMRSLAAPLSPGSCTQPPPRASPGGQGSSYQPWCVWVLVHGTALAQLLSTWELSPWCRRHHPCSRCWGLDSCVCVFSPLQYHCDTRGAVLLGDAAGNWGTCQSQPLGWGTAWGQLSLPFSYSEAFRGFRSLFLSCKRLLGGCS